MLDHHIQRSIVYRLAFLQSARFSELKPDIIESKLFDYHLKKVITAGLVEKDDDGKYRLTPEGRRLGIHVNENSFSGLDKASSVIFMVVRRQSDKSWLLYKRKTHPLINRVGFMHGTPNAKQKIIDTARETVAQKTGLDCRFSVLGGGYFRVYDKDQLESFTHFSLLVCEDAKGDLNVKDKTAEYWWQKNPDFHSKEMLPNMEALAKEYERGKLFVIDQTLEV